MNNVLALGILCLAGLGLAFVMFILPALLTKRRKENSREPGVLVERVRDGYPVVLPWVEAMKASQSGKFRILGGADQSIESNKKFEDLAD